MTRFEKGLDLLPFYLFEPSYFGNLTTEMERMLEELGAGRRAFRPVSPKPETEVAWAPRIEIVLEHNELMVRAELPGVEPKDVTVEVRDEQLILKGARHKVFKSSKEDYVTSGILGRIGPGADPGARRISRVDSGTTRAIANHRKPKKRSPVVPQHIDRGRRHWS